MNLIDLHSHSTASDGLLSPSALVELAANSGVEILALTDHDDVSGLEEACIAADKCNIHFIRGVEISVSWRGHTLHIIGLQIDSDHPVLISGLAELRAGRKIRAERIADSLAKAGINGALEGAQRHAGNPEILNRTHFARYLVEAGYASNMRTVFNRFMSGGKPGHVKHEWVQMGDAISWICASGGQAVLAHPGRYVLSDVEMCELLGEFRSLGGRGIEVVTGSHRPDQYPVFAKLAIQFDLLASIGSDYHGPGENRFPLGRLPELPSGVTPIWRDWPEVVV
ncbi:MAG TPA: 3',5'-nucleoside bisphosphate phosphatase [Burkholderiales bacterium]|nr:3',5'-nucleoside bisphosphate phosphatase [Burkholderiales bacterium]